MTKRTARDRLLLHAIGAAVVVLAIGFALAWWYLQHQEKLSRETAYLILPPVAISRDGHSMRASFAFKTSAADAGWAQDNKPLLEQVVKKALLEADPVKSRGPGGLKALQESVRNESNAILQTSRVQEVVVTDFLVSEGDY